VKPIYLLVSTEPVKLLLPSVAPVGQPVALKFPVLEELVTPTLSIVPITIPS